MWRQRGKGPLSGRLFKLYHYPGALTRFASLLNGCLSAFGPFRLPSFVRSSFHGSSSQGGGNPHSRTTISCACTGVCASPLPWRRGFLIGCGRWKNWSNKLHDKEVALCPDDLRELFEKKARSGDGAFAVAYALLELADAQDKAAIATFDLGTRNAGTQMGAIELLALEVKGLAAAIIEAGNSN